MAANKLKNTHKNSENAVVNWQMDKTMLECNKHMFENELATDVTFTVTDRMLHSENDGEHVIIKRIIKAHKYILMARSHVFWNMFSQEFSEQSGSVNVDDVGPDAFYNMIKYLYTDEIEITPELVMFILHVANKYMISSLEKKCYQFMETNLDTSNAFMLLEQCLFFGNKKLAGTCMRKIVTDTARCFESDGFFKISQTTLCHMLNADMFTAMEIDIFNACHSWATHACMSRNMEVCGDNLRVVLGPCLPHIHFPVIDLDDFCAFVQPSGILPPEDENKLMCYLTEKESENKSTPTLHDELPKPDPYPHRDRFLTRSLNVNMNMDTSKLERMYIRSCETSSLSINSSVEKSFHFRMQMDSSCEVFMNEITICNLANNRTWLAYLSRIKAVAIDLNFNGVRQRCNIPTSVSVANYIFPINLHPALRFQKGVTSFLIEILVVATPVKEFTTKKSYVTMTKAGENFRKMPGGLLEYNNTSLNVHLQLKCVDNNSCMPVSGFKFSLQC